MFNLNFDGYPTIYEKAAEKLIYDLSNTKEFAEQKLIFKNFASHFSVVPVIWKAWIKLELETNGYRKYQYDKNLSNLFHQSQKHFYIDADEFEMVYRCEEKPYRKILTFPEYKRLQSDISHCSIIRKHLVVFLKETIQLPYSKLDEILEIYKSCSENHENAKKLYEKLMTAKTENEWLNLLLETNDDEFVIQNVEFRLSNDPCNKEIWKYYFDFFEKRENDIRILDVYLRYCRLFIEDSIMLEIYATKVDNFKMADNYVAKWENDLIKFRQYFILNSNFILSEPPEIESKPNRHETCKYFFIQKQIIPIWYLGVGWHENLFYHENSLYMGYKKSINLKHKIWLENSASFYGNLKFMDKIHRCDIKFLRITGYFQMTYTKYKILVQSEMVQEIHLYQINIKMEDGEYISLEKIMEYLPNAHKITISLDTMVVTSNSSQALDNLKRNVKIEKLHISKLTENFEPEAFCIFLKNNLSPNSEFYICYTGQIDVNYQNAMKAAVEKIVPYQENKLPKVLIHFPHPL